MDQPTRDDGFENISSISGGVGFSRRGFLKILGSGVVGSVTASLSMPDQLVAATQQPDALWSLVATSPLFLKALENVQSQGCGFTIDAASFTVVAQQAEHVGLHIRQSSQPTQRLGIDIFATIDTIQGTVVAVQYVVGTSLEGLLDLYSVLLTPASLEPIFIMTRSGLVEQSGPHQATNWTFPRPEEEIAPPPDPLPDEGWPPDVVSPLHWFYAGQSGVQWSDDSVPVLRCTQVSEQRSSDPSDTRFFDLPYWAHADPEPEPTEEPTVDPLPGVTATPTA